MLCYYFFFFFFFFLADLAGGLLLRAPSLSSGERVAAGCEASRARSRDDNNKIGRRREMAKAKAKTTASAATARLADRVHGGELLRERAVERAVGDRVLGLVVLLHGRVLLLLRVAALVAKVLAVAHAEKVHEDLHDAAVRAARGDGGRALGAQRVEHGDQKLVERQLVAAAQRRRRHGAHARAARTGAAAHGARQLEHGHHGLEVVARLERRRRAARARHLDLVHLAAAHGRGRRHARAKIRALHTGSLYR